MKGEKKPRHSREFSSTPSLGRDKPDAVASDFMIKGIISIRSRDALVLFDPGSTYSYVFSLFSPYLDFSRESLGSLVYLSTPVGDSVIVYRVYPSCVMTFRGYETRADLMLLDITDFEVILGMGWLSSCYAIFDCHATAITLAMMKFPRLQWRGTSISTSSQVITFLKARHMVENRCLAYLAYVRDIAVETPTIDSVLLGWELSIVIPSDLLGMPLERDIDFSIDLTPGIRPISIPPYRKSPKELKELKK
ncbi:uncharacterized protein LOC142167153 [Nicotiana tabacum]|uniref:Uncharacterized protein LOC142167153 n=1 Tax=Nicotiana tabacum TaxID=4097 RepID=A0AC58SEP8_TOBAC